MVMAALAGAPAMGAAQGGDASTTGQVGQAGTAAQWPENPQPQAAPSTPQPQTDKIGTTTAQPINPFDRFLNTPEVKPMTVKEKGELAIKNVLDPFNGLTILAASGISVAADSHSAYGPGMAGFGRSVGVSFTQDMTNNFFNVFLIPSIVHQDPHYHRWPHATIKRRALHCILQVFWTRGDTREGMLNYANLLGDAIDDEIGNLYVPGRRTNAAATAERYGIDLATAPIDNAITEFLPDIARRIHVHVVFIQRIINTVAKTPGTANSGQWTKGLRIQGTGRQIDAFEV
jgi:hypothetical protein